MNTRIRLLPLALSAALALGLAACGQQEQQAAQQAAPQKVELVAPTDINDERAWRLYLVEVTKQNLPQRLRSSPFMYYLPPTTRENFDAEYDSQLDNVSATVARGVLPGNMLAFGSPESARMADLIVEAFQDAPAGAFNGVRVLFIGKAEDSERVREGLEASGAEFVFVEIK